MPSHAARIRAALLAGLLLAGSIVPDSIRAQPAPDAATWRITPAAALLFDEYDLGDDGSTAGPLLQLHAARRIRGSLMGAASFGYARVGDVGSHQPTAPYLLFRNEWLFASAGPAIEVPVRRATLALAIEIGAAWRRTAVSGAVGNAPPDPWLDDDGYSVRAAVLPRVGVHYPIGPKMDLGVSAGAYLLGIPESIRTSPTIGLGLSFRP